MQGKQSRRDCDKRLVSNTSRAMKTVTYLSSSSTSSSSSSSHKGNRSAFHCCNLRAAMLQVYSAHDYSKHQACSHLHQ
jgi:hypothetical protein